MYLDKLSFFKCKPQPRPILDKQNEKKNTFNKQVRPNPSLLNPNQAIDFFKSLSPALLKIMALDPENMLRKITLNLVTLQEKYNFMKKQGLLTKKYSNKKMLKNKRKQKKFKMQLAFFKQEQAVHAAKEIQENKNRFHLYL